MLGSQGSARWVGWRERREEPVEDGRLASRGQSAGSIQIWVTRNRPSSLLCDAELAVGGNRTRQAWLPCDSDKDRRGLRNIPSDGRLVARDLSSPACATWLRLCGGRAHRLCRSRVTGRGCDVHDPVRGGPRNADLPHVHLIQTRPNETPLRHHDLHRQEEPPPLSRLVVDAE